MTDEQRRIDAFARENKLLRQKLDQTEREGRELKRSLFELSGRYNSLLSRYRSLVSEYETSEAVLKPMSEIDDSTFRPYVYNELDGDAQVSTLESLESTKTTAKRQEYFAFKKELRGHTAAVYAVAYSPDGSRLASGSFDSTVRIWDLGSQTEHELCISDVSWSTNDEVLSSSFDHFIRRFNINTLQCIASHETKGMAMCVRPSPTDYHLYYAGDSAGIAYLLDSRTSSTTTVDLQASVNTLCVPLANVLITGDSKGSINVFDIRKLGEPTYSALVSPSRQPLSNIICSGTLSTPLPERVLSANGFDNVLRVYELESALSGSGSDGLVPAYSFTGFRNKNWPIKASIYQGKDYHRSGTGSGAWAHEDDDVEYVVSTFLSLFSSRKSVTMQESILICTGSANSSSLMFRIPKEGGPGDTIQTLQGHRDRVYATSFHPTLPYLATASADFTLRLWRATR